MASDGVGRGDPVVLRLSHDEALVLFEWLHRMEDAGDYQGLYDDQAEQRALWNLSALLERELAEPFSAHYTELLQAARGRLRDQEH